MKKIIFIVLGILVVLALLDGLVHSRLVQNQALTLFKESIQESGWDVTIDRIDKAYPTLELEGVTITAPDFVLKFGSLKANFSFLRLLKNEFVFTNLIGDQVSWNIQKSATPREQLPGKKSNRFRLVIEEFSLTNATLFDDFLSAVKGSFSCIENRLGTINFRANGTFLPHSEHPFLARNWNLSSRFHRHSNATWEFSTVRIDSNIATLKGSGTLDSEGNPEQSSIQIQSNYITTVFANIDLKQNTITAAWRAPLFNIQDEIIRNANGEIKLEWLKGTIEGTTISSANYRNLAWTAKAPFSWNQKEGLVFPQIELSSPAMQAKGKLQIANEATVQLEASFTSEQINRIFPEWYGSAIGKIDWKKNGNVRFDARILEAHYKDFSAGVLKIYSDIQDPLGAFTGNFVFDIQKGNWRNLIVDEASIETTKEGENWPFSLNIYGKWEHPLQLDIDGFWSYKQENLLISLQNTEGSFFNHPLLLPTPASFAMSPTAMRLKDFSLEIADASISASIQQNNDQGEAFLKIKRLPIDFLSLNPLDVEVEGALNLDLTIVEKGKDLRGDLIGNFENLEISVIGQLDPLNGEGNFESHFSRDRLNLKGKLFVRQAPLASIDLSLPIHFEMRPFTADLLYNKKIEGAVSFNGQVEEFLDFFNLGSHRLEGAAICDFQISNTLERPYLHGQCDFKNGYYQNYFTGTELHNIQAYFQAEREFLILKKLTATDIQKTGTLTATGKFDFLPLDHFPFVIDANFSRMNTATVDLIATEASGSIQIKGDARSSLATGQIDLIETDVTVPTRIPKTLPDLEVTYKNTIAPPYTFEGPNLNPYPLYLDLMVNASDGIFISGRGLDSEWRGNFQVGGTQTEVLTKGGIELIRGNFTFAGRTFKLSEGSLKFSGTPNAQPQLTLSATIQVKEVLVTASLKGPLNDPQISLESNPALPLGTIMAYLLFGQDITEISSVQALQLASSIAAFAGDGPGILEQTKKSLGVDRIQIITVPSASTESGETIAVQVGKYVTDGVLVSYSQTAENTAGNLSVEVEVKGNLSFILESEQTDDQKQGKFTFRWARTY